MLKERTVTPLHGFVVLPFILAGLALTIVGLYHAAQARSVPAVLAMVVLGVSLFICLFGFFIVNPNEARVLQLFGEYKGTARAEGLRWANPFLTKKHVSQRIRNFESERLKVNDHDGNPIDIAAVVVWKVVDTAEALFQVDEYQDFVHVQSEAALRNLATRYPYDAHVEGETSLRSHTVEIADKLTAEIQDRLNQAGVQVLEARISHLAYAAEIASAMLQRQQAGAIVAARHKIVEGAVGMVESALALLEKGNIVHLDGERRAAMVSNLLVVLCGDRSAQPIVNTGTLHQ